MFSHARNRLGTAGLLMAIIALVAALGGGAYAASGSLTSKEKKEVKKIANAEAKKLQGTGPAGPAGPKGDTGSQGPQGKEGSQGKEGPQGKEGKEGPFVPQVPSGKTLKGVWSAATAKESPALIPITFAFPVSPAPTAVLIKESGESAFKVGPTGLEGFLATEEIEAVCPGSASDPLAKSGFFCVYTSKETNMEIAAAELFAGVGNPTKYGASIPVTNPSIDKGAITGTWAVTA
jgi:hypothetical protein